MALTDLTRISTSGIATGTSLSGAILHGDAHFRGSQVGVTSALFDSSEDELKFNDNVKLKFGDGGDLNFYHTGSHSFIDDTGTGNLYIQSNHVNIDSGGQEMANFFYGGAVELFHSNTQRFRTTSTGSVVTGILTATSFSGPVVGNTNNASGISTFYDLRVSNNLTVEGTTTTLDTNVTGVDRLEINANSNTTTAIVGIQSGSADILNLSNASGEQVTILSSGNVGIGSAVPELDLDVTRVSSGDNVVKFENRASALSLIKYPNVNNPDVKAGSDYGHFAVYTGGDSGSRKLKVEHGGDVKVENGFFAVTDPSEKIGIGLANPVKPLHIYTAGIDSEIRFQTNSGTEQNSYISLRHATGHLDFYTVQSGTNMKFHIANNERLKLENSGLTVTGELQLPSGNQIKLSNDANSANATIDCDGGARLHLKSYSQSVATFEEGVGTVFYQGTSTNRLQITPTGSIIVGAGTTIKIPDKIMHYGDEDTYFDFGTNTINLHAGGVTGVTVLDASVRVPTKLGINGVAPQTPLDVAANGSGYAINVRGRSSDNVGEIRFTSNNYGTLYGVLQTGATYLKISTGGQERLELDVDETTFNNPGADTDFRIRTPAQTHMFYVNAGTNQVSIKTGSPASGAELTVQGRTHTDTQFTIGSNSTLDAGVQATIYKPATNTLAFATAGANERLRIDNNGKLILGTEFVNGANSTGSISFYLSGVRGAYGGLDTNAVIFDNQTAAVDAGGTLQFAGYSGTSAIVKAAIRGGNEGSASTQNGYFAVFTRPSSGGLTEKLRIDSGGSIIGAGGIVNVTGEINVDHSGGGSGAALNGISGENCGVVRWRGDNHHAIILRGSSNADGSVITGGNTTEFREYGHFVFKTGTGSMGERIRITNSEMKFTANQTFNADNTYWIGTNGIKPSRVYGHKFVHREGTSNGVGVNEQEAIWYGGNINVFHDNAVLNTSNFTWGLTGSRGYALLRIRNNAGSPQAIYAEAGSITSGSDYRMKENIVEITNGIETVKKLKPSIYNIRKSYNPNDDGKKHHGFIAHEVQEAIPNIGNIVSGTKDAMEEVFYQDEDENIPEGKKPGDSTGAFTDKPDYQGIDYGHMTPVLAAAIKELITKVETLEAEVAALKSS